MCGFFAVFQSERVVKADSARSALDMIAHRGPDASGEFLDGEVFLGHRRLSIIDLATGDQPMHSSDGRFVIIFNGEIYNFLELRECLQRDGVSFRTRSDTEVILEGYRRWKANVVQRLNGMFAFVIWDREKHRLFAARDRLGIKPLCWALHKGALLISSTLEPFTHLENGFSQLDPVALRDLMAFDYIPSPRSIFKQVHKLDPGSRLEWSLGKGHPKIERYWSPSLANRDARAPDEFELESLFERAVERQMVSDVPIGVFLSGGIDSSLTVAMMARHSSKPLRTFSVAFTEGELDESGIAAKVARQFGTEHTILQAEDIGAESLLNLLGSLDEPFCDPAFVPTYALSKITKSHVKVALSGDGGDEVFGGYQKYLRPDGLKGAIPLAGSLHRILESIPWRPRGMSHFYWRTLSSDDLFRFDWTCYGDFPVFRKDMRQLLAPSLHSVAQIEEFFEPWERRAGRYGDRFDPEVVMRTDLETYLSENCLVKTDRASMLASLEVRVPYLDETILDRILPLTLDKKIANGQLKALLLPIARRLLPREVWDRPKHGFNVPLSIRMAGSWRPAIEAALDWGAANFRIFNYDYLRYLHAINLKEKGVSGNLWNPFVLLAWAMPRSIKI
jgi:asparagine synthase (glutamine-hydrolysing)